MCIGPAHDVGVVALKGRDVEAPAPAVPGFGKRLEQELAYAGDLDVLRQDGFRLAAALRSLFEGGVETGEHILVASVGVGDRRDIGHHQFGNACWRELGQLHAHLAPME